MNTPSHPISAAGEAKRRPIPPRYDSHRELMASVTFVAWLGAALIGGAGLLLSYRQAVLPPRPLPPIAVQNIQVALTSEPEAVVQPDPGKKEPTPAPPVSDVVAPPALPEQLSVPAATPMAQVAIPTPAIAFAVPVEGPIRGVEPAAAAVTAPRPAVAAAAASPAAPRRITFGVGEGRQPQPEYPPEAIRADQQGRVVVRFTVTEDGHVAAAEPSVPCRWPVLNRAAARAIADRWRFPAGPVRVYEVEITFRLEG